MASAVTTRLNHYERLGLSRDASSDDIARAFAREMSPFRPRPVGDLAQITAAYEVLRNPARRRAYDESIAPKPAPTPEPNADGEPAARRDSWPFVASARIGSAELPALHALPRSESHAGAVAVPGTSASLEPEPGRESSPRIRDDRSLQALFEDRFRLVEGNPRDWKRPATIVGGLFAGVALLGAALGWYASRDIEPAQAKQAVAFPVPRARAPAASAPPAQDPQVTKARPERRSNPASAARRTRHVPAPRQPVAPEEQRAEDIPDIPTEQVAAVTATDSAAAPATIALPNAVIARTIGRIGYACGSVVSTTAVDGATGVFKVTCTSGDSYRAAPVRGRYHFKRWAG
jgi:hypothetical protein